MSRYRKSMGEIMAEVEKIGQELPEVSPPGWEGSVKAMKKHKDIDNPWALAWHMKNKGDKPHYKDQDGKPEKKAKYKNEEIDTVGVVQLDEELPKHLTKFLDKKGNPNKEAQARIDAGRRKREVAARTKDVTPKGYGPSEEVELDEKHDCDEVHPDVSHEDWVDQKDEDMSLAPKGKGRKAVKALYQGKVDEWGNSPLDQAIPKHLGRPDTPKKRSPGDEKLLDKARRRHAQDKRERDTEKLSAPKEEVELAIMSLDHKEPDRKLKITSKGLDALRKDRDRRAAEPKVSITKKGLLALKKAAEGLDLKKIRAQKRAKAAKNMKDVEKVFNKKTKPTTDMKVPPRHDAPDRGYFEEVEMEEMQFKVKLKGLPSFYVPSKSAASVKAMLRKQMRRPDDIESIDRVTKSAKKRDFRLRVQGKEQDGE